jgi:hypothetical protein
LGSTAQEKREFIGPDRAVYQAGNGYGHRYKIALPGKEALEVGVIISFKTPFVIIMQLM